MLLSVRAAATYELAAESFMYLMVEPPLVGAVASRRGRAARDDPHAFLRAQARSLRQSSAPACRSRGDVHV